jgi:acyl carrier protein
LDISDGHLFHFPIVDFSKAVVMSSSDALRQLQIDFFGLPSDIEPENITQKAIPAWDSLASVQLIAELQGRFNVDFDVEQLESLRSYSGIATALSRKALLISAPALKTHPDCR